MDSLSCTVDSWHMRQPHPTACPNLSDQPAAVGPPATPRWVKVSGLVVLLLVLVVVVMVALRGGDHGPGMHGAQGALAPATARVLGLPV